MKDKKELQTARDEWPIMPEDKKKAIFEKVVAVHCRKMGFDPPKDLEFYDEKPGESGETTLDGKVRINRKGYGFNDFELMMDTIFHENSHNWQIQLSQRMNGTKPPPIGKDDPIYKQVVLFDLNANDYDTGDAYNEQPLEAHSFRAGPVSAKALMRALSN
jgi:hypothetical protein